MFPFGRTQKSTKKESTKLVDVDELFKSIDVDGHGYLTLEQAQRALTAKDVAPPSPTRLLAALCSAPTWKEEARAELKAAASTVRVDVSDLSALISYYSRCQKALKDCPELNGELEAAWARVAALELEVDKSHAENAESRARFEQTLEGMEARGQQERVQLKEQLEKLDAQVELNTRERQRERESSKNELEELQMKLEGKSKTLVELVRDSKKQEHELKDRVDELNELKLRFLAVTAPKHEEPVSEEARQLEAEVMARAERESHEGTCTFWFVKAARIKEAPEGTLPSFRTLVQENAFVERTLAASDAYRAAFSDTHLALSHRWETIDAPDTKGKQLEKLQLHLCEHEAIEFVWVDFCCLPQGVRTPDEKASFKWQLSNVNLLFLGCSVLMLVDMTYLSRFWTQTEAWLAMRRCTSDGLVPARERRFHIVCIHNAEQDREGVKLESHLIQKTTKEALEALRAPDVTVTNESDKQTQLDKIEKLEPRVKEEFCKARAAALLADATAAAMAAAASARTSIASSSANTSSPRSQADGQSFTGSSTASLDNRLRESVDEGPHAPPKYACDDGSSGAHAPSKRSSWTRKPKRVSFEDGSAVAEEASGESPGAQEKVGEKERRLSADEASTFRAKLFLDLHVKGFTVRVLWDVLQEEEALLLNGMQVADNSSRQSQSDLKEGLERFVGARSKARDIKVHVLRAIMSHESLAFADIREQLERAAAPPDEHELERLADALDEQRVKARSKSTGMQRIRRLFSGQI